MNNDEIEFNDSTHGNRGPENHFGALQIYKKILLLTDGYSNPFLAKTAINLLRYRQSDIAAVLDVQHAGKDAGELFNVGHGVPVVDKLPVDLDAVFIGIAPPGGKLPDHWRPIISSVLRQGVDVVSGLHDFLSDDPEFVKLADTHQGRIIDVRRNTLKQTATAAPFRDGCLRVHTVGHDCSVGKMVVSVEVSRELAGRGVDSHFLATGQTGIMISGDGVPVDCVVSDFVNGAIESLVRRHETHEVLLIEGQGSISHPSFSAVTLGLLHGCAPHGLIFCYEAGRDRVKGLENIPLLDNRRLIQAYESAASLRHPCRVVGIGINSRRLTDQQAIDERKRVEDEFELPACDVFRNGASVLANAVLELKKAVFP